MLKVVATLLHAKGMHWVFQATTTRLASAPFGSSHKPCMVHFGGAVSNWQAGSWTQRAFRPSSSQKKPPFLQQLNNVCLFFMGLFFSGSPSKVLLALFTDYAAKEVGFRVLTARVVWRMGCQLCSKPCLLATRAGHFTLALRDAFGVTPLVSLLLASTL